MKRFISFLLAASICLSLTACGKEEEKKAAFVPFEFPIEEYTVNPLTGEIGEDDYPASHAPVAVMINNIKAALPQYGVCEADIIYEVVAEGGITRMLALYSDYRDVEKIGSVRSARPYYAALAAGHGAVLFHFGGSEEAYSLIRRSGMRAVDGIAYSESAYFLDEVRRRTYPKEHCSFTGNSYIDVGLSKKGYDLAGETAPAFSFLSVLEPPTNITYGKANTVTWDFSGYDKGAQLIYNPETLEYEKQEYGHPQMDEAVGQVLSFDNCLVVFDTIKQIDDVGHMRASLTEGKGYYFTKGTYKPITWKKGDFDSKMSFYEEDGRELRMNVGKTYIAIVADTREDTLVIE